MSGLQLGAPTPVDANTAAAGPPWALALPGHVGRAAPDARCTCDCWLLLLPSPDLRGAGASVVRSRQARWSR
jgi:hypothetical protein